MAARASRGGPHAGEAAHRRARARREQARLLQTSICPLRGGARHRRANGRRGGLRPPAELGCDDAGRARRAARPHRWRWREESSTSTDPKQLGHTCSRCWALRTLKKNQRGYSTDAAVAQRACRTATTRCRRSSCANQRSLAKIKSTYIDALPRNARRRRARAHCFNEIGDRRDSVDSVDLGSVVVGAEPAEHPRAHRFAAVRSASASCRWRRVHKFLLAD